DIARSQNTSIDALGTADPHRSYRRRTLGLPVTTTPNRWTDSESQPLGARLEVGFVGRAGDDRIPVHGKAARRKPPSRALDRRVRRFSADCPPLAHCIARRALRRIRRHAVDPAEFWTPLLGTAALARG